MPPSPGPIPDEEFQALLEGARQGDDTSFAAIWRTFNPAVIRFLSASAGHQDAADVAATVWFDVVRGLDRFSGDESGFRAWLFTVARHRLVDLRRAERRRPRLVEADLPLDDFEAVATDVAHTTERTCSTEVAIALINTLSPDQAEVLLLRIVADLDVAAVAGIVGKRPGTVRVLAHRGLRQLAQQLTEEAARPPSRVKAAG